MASNRTASLSSSHSTLLKIHPDTSNPNKAWDKLKVKQTVQDITLPTPDYPVQDDHIRFICVSDSHTQLEKQPLSFVPDGDVLLHAGDFSNIGLPRDIQGFNHYLGKLQHRLKVVIAGNHDLTFDLNLVTNRRQYLEKQFNIKETFFEKDLEKMGVKTTRELLTNCIYLEDSGIDVCGIKIYGSPWQPEFCGWGFNLERGDPLLEKWNLIPDDTDILITHGPPIGHGDLCFDGLRAGCVELLTSIQERVKPKYNIFGHIHEGYGVTSDGKTTYINASTCTLRYKATNPPIVFDFPIPNGHTKAELLNIPTCNLLATNPPGLNSVK